MAAIQFECWNCGGKELEEVMGCVTQVTVIDVIDDSGAIDYDSKRMTTDFGEVIRYQCVACNVPVLNSNEGYVTTPKELVKAIKESNEKIAKRDENRSKL